MLTTEKHPSLKFDIRNLFPSHSLVEKMSAETVFLHHLFFADLMIKKEGFGEIIPRFQVVIFDEAHKVEEIATTYFGESLSTNQLMELVSDLEKEGKNLQETKGQDLKRQLDLL